MHEGHRKRLIQKLLDKKEVLSDHELLEILLFFAIPRKNVNEEAHRLIDDFGSLKNVLNVDADTLESVEGIGEKSAVFLSLIGEIYRRADESIDTFPTIYSYETSKDYYIESYKWATEEVFSALFLDGKGKVMMRKVFCSHSESMVDIDIKDLLKGTTSLNPSSVIICHNHLSDSVEPSPADDRATMKIYFALEISGIKLLDHIIVNKNSTYSYRTSGKLENLIKKYEINI